MCLSHEKESRDKLCGTPMIALPSHSGRVPATGICTMMLDYGFHSQVHSWSVLAAGAPATTYRLYSRKIKTKASPTNKKFLPCWINGLFFVVVLFIWCVEMSILLHDSCWSGTCCTCMSLLISNLRCPCLNLPMLELQIRTTMIVVSQQVLSILFWNSTPQFNLCFIYRDFATCLCLLQRN